MSPISRGVQALTAPISVTFTSMVPAGMSAQVNEVATDSDREDCECPRVVRALQDAVQPRQLMSGRVR